MVGRARVKPGGREPLIQMPGREMDRGKRTSEAGKGLPSRTSYHNMAMTVGHAPRNLGRLCLHCRCFYNQNKCVQHRIQEHSLMLV